jgi:hypothetical protein
MYGKLALSHKSRAQKVGKPDDNCNVIGGTYYCSFGKFQSATTMCYSGYHLLEPNES